MLGSPEANERQKVEIYLDVVFGKKEGKLLAKVSMRILFEENRICNYLLHVYCVERCSGL